MKKALLIALAMLFALGVGALADYSLVNGNFEDTTSHALGWNINAGVNLEQYSQNWMVPGDCPAATASPWGLSVVNNWGISDLQATQRVNVAAGQYTVNGSGWFRLLSGNVAGVSSVSLQLVLDGSSNVVASTTLVGVTGKWGEWTQIALPTWTGNVASNLRLRAAMHTDGQGGWGEVVADNFEMSVVPVPEPSSIVALMSGLAGISGMVIRRRK